MEKYYGLLSGMAYTVPYSICGLGVGLLQGGFNRKRLLAFTMILAGLTQLFTGMADSLAVLCVMRVLHAACNSITNPLFYSLTADYFP